MGDLNIEIKQSHTNGMEALSTGATDGLKLAANIAAMLIAFISFVAMINFFLAFLGTSMESILGLTKNYSRWNDI